MASISELLTLYPEIIDQIATSQQKHTILGHRLLNQVNEGNFSLGNGVEINTEQGEILVFMAQPNGTGFGLSNSIAAQLEVYLEAHRHLPNTMEPLHLFVVTDSGEVIDVSKLSHLLRVAEHLPVGSVSILHEFKRSLAEGLSSTEVYEYFSMLNQKLIQAILEIHSQPIPPKSAVETDNLYSESLWRVHADRELTAGIIHKHNFSTNSWITLKEASSLRSIMEQFEHATRHLAHRIKPLHGDAWWSNSYVTPDKEIKLIDQSRSAYGEPAIDVGLAIGDAINFSIVLEKELSSVFHRIAQEGLNLYIDQSGDTEIRIMLPLIVAFKTFALSMNSPVLPDSTRRQLFTTGYGCIFQAVEQIETDAPMAFEIEKLPFYEAVGRQHLSATTPTQLCPVV